MKTIFYFAVRKFVCTLGATTNIYGLKYRIQFSKSLACVAGAKRGGGGGREKGKREGSACSKSLCFCITPTNFLVIRLRLLSIKCRYTRHCRKTLHSRTKEIRLVIQIQKALWRKLEPLFSRNKKALRFKRGQRNCACIRGQILPTRKQ